MKFCLYKVYIDVNILTKFPIPQSHSIREKFDANFQLSSHPSQILCDQETSNLVYIKYNYIEVNI